MMRIPRFTRRHSLLLRWSVLSAIGALLLVAIIAAVSHEKRLIIPAANAKVEGLTSVLRQEVGQDQAMPLRFTDVAERMGVRFQHFPAQRASIIAEDMGSGVAWGDYDNDGFADLFLVNFAGSVVPGAKVDRSAGRSRLYRNVRGDHFEDVTDSAGIHFDGFGMGAAWGDYNNDGNLDLYITANGPNVLYENLGDGTFHDVTEKCRVQDAQFSTGCSWVDYDRDGHLDLYVCNYVQFTFREGDRLLKDPQYSEQPYTTNPSSYPPQRNSLFHNNGDGTFAEVAAQAGVADPNGRSLSASWVDLDNDGWVDLYVADDVSWNGVFRNKGDGTFEDIGASSLAADYRSAMGLAIADFDNDLDHDILITHWIAQENALYRNMLLDNSNKNSARGGLWFLDAADEFGLGQIALDMVGWSTGFCDFDNDGLRDLWMVNGHTFERTDNRRLLVPQPAFLFWNRGTDRFVEVAARACQRLAEPMVGRGGAQADFDNDGRVDLALQPHQGRTILLHNGMTPAGHWLRLDLRQKGGNTFALGARAYVSAGGRTQMAEVGCSSAYLSQHELTLHFGLGGATQADTVRIVWPDGREEVHKQVAADHLLKLVHNARYPVAPQRSSQSTTTRPATES